MIGYIKGELAYKYEDRIIVENNGIGFEIFVPGSVLDRMPAAGSDVKLHTYLYVREDQMSLFGFLTARSPGSLPITGTGAAVSGRAITTSRKRITTKS